LPILASEKAASTCASFCSILPRGLVLGHARHREVKDVVEGDCVAAGPWNSLEGDEAVETVPCTAKGRIRPSGSQRPRSVRGRSRRPWQPRSHPASYRGRGTTKLSQARTSIWPASVPSTSGTS
jgi:hypothetical protein